MNDVLRTEGLFKTYKSGEIAVDAIRGVDISIQEGEFTAIAGPSGSGKSTLLNLISGLDRPTKGEVWLGAKKISAMSGNELSDFRRDHIGFVFQSYNLIPVLTVAENIEYIMLIQGVAAGERKNRVKTVLDEVGISGMQDRKPAQLSGGQQQRVAVARAIVSSPDIILADEPTANLDSENAEKLIRMMRDLNEQKNITFVFSTHDSRIMDNANRLIVLMDGTVYSDDKRI